MFPLQSGSVKILPAHGCRPQANCRVSLCASCQVLASAGGGDCPLPACRYLEGKAQLLYPEPRDVFPCELINSDVCRPPSSYV